MGQGETKSTIVANGYHTDIMVFVKANQASSSESSTAVTHQDRQVVDCATSESGFTTITSGTFHAFPLDGYDGLVFVTIKMGGGCPHFNVPVAPNANVIVSKRGTLNFADTSNIWTDITGCSHRPANAQECPEYLKTMEIKMKDARLEEQVKAAFKIFDKNGDGFISATELKDIMDYIGVKISYAEAARAIKEADLDGDGRLSYYEFLTWSR